MIATHNKTWGNVCSKTLSYKNSLSRLIITPTCLAEMNKREEQMKREFHQNRWIRNTSPLKRDPWSLPTKSDRIP